MSNCKIITIINQNSGIGKTPTKIRINLNYKEKLTMFKHEKKVYYINNGEISEPTMQFASA